MFGKKKKKKKDEAIVVSKKQEDALKAEEPPIEKRRLRGFEIVTAKDIKRLDENIKPSEKHEDHTISYIKSVRIDLENIKLPERKTSGSAGYDFFTPKRIKIRPGQHSEIIFTNIKAYMQEGEVLELYIRSSLGFKHGVILSNSTGIIDQDYYNNEENEGNIGVRLYNSGDKKVVIEEGEAIMQGIFKNYLVADNGNLENKRVGGIGSTNK